MLTIRKIMMRDEEVVGGQAWRDEGSNKKGIVRGRLHLEVTGEVFETSFWAATPRELRAVLKSQPPPRLTNLPGQWLQCQANGSNVCRVLRPLKARNGMILNVVLLNVYQSWARSEM